ncbi:hypothetical protein G9A89_018859 [Geosiphon pyriformis]|nr:hypothetical protein G9A89_018859 [Geosiphon pyriformis]
MSFVLGELIYFKCVSSLQHYGIVFIEQLCDWSGALNSYGSVFIWFEFSIWFLDNFAFFSVNSPLLDGYNPSDIFQFCEFGVVSNNLLYANTGCFFVYMNRSLSGLETLGVKAKAAVFFEDINLGLGVKVFDLLFSIIVELQAIVLALECILFSHFVNLFINSQTALDTCRSELMLVKGHFGILRNKHADILVKHLSYLVSKCYVKTSSIAVFGNSRHFVQRVFQSFKSFLVWHPDSYLMAGFTSKWTAALYHQLFITVHKQLYDKCYSNVVCLFCDNVEVLDHAFSCPFDAAGHVQLLNTHASVWDVYFGLFCSSSCVLQLLFICVSDVAVNTIVDQHIVDFVCKFCLVFWKDIWLVRVKHQAFMEKNATIDCSITVIKKAAKVSGSSNGFRPVLPKKKRRDSILEDGFGGKNIGLKVQSNHSWNSEAGDTTESESINMEKECLVEETSFDYDESSAFAGRDLDQTPTGSKVKTKKTLSKPLGKIDFSPSSNDNDVLLDAPLVLPPLVKNLVNVSVWKSFALDIGLDKVVGKFSHEKLQVVRKLFSKINDFGEASTPSKFFGIIQATFTSELGSIKATKKAIDAKIVVNTNLKKSTGHSDQAVVMKEIPVETLAETVHAALSEFGVVKSIKMQLVGLWQKAIIEFEKQSQVDLLADRWSILIGKDAVHIARSDLNKVTWDKRDLYRALLYTLPVKTNAHDIWDFIGSVGEKTCVINHYSVTYVQIKCAVICFKSAESLDAVMETTPVLRDTHFHWSYVGSATCAKCGRLDHTSLGCGLGGKLSFGRLPHQMLSDSNKSRLTTIYAKHSALVTQPAAFGGVSWASVVSESSFFSLSGQEVSSKNGSSLGMKSTPLVSLEINDRFATLEHSLASLAECVNKLAKRLNTLGPMVSQLSPGC